MAGDWVKMRVGLVTHPRVMRLAENLLGDAQFIEWANLSFGVPGFPPQPREEAERERYAALRVTRYIAVTALLRFWGYAREHAKDDETITGLWPDDVDEITGVPGFAASLERIGWIEFDRERGCALLPNFKEHNAISGIQTASAKRQKRYRDRKKGAENSDVTRDVTVTPREEKRREEVKPSRASRSGLNGAFTEFWNAYPRKKSKGDAEKAWLKIKPDEQLTERILASVRQATTSADWQRDGGKFVPYPASWLNAKGWEDEIQSSPSSRQAVM